VLYFLSHAGLRVQRASGVPHALSKLRACAIFLEADDLTKLGRFVSRECEAMFADDVAANGVAV
jgi:hypothetical protein